MDKDRLDLAVVLTTVYADVFDYPLRPEELQRYLIGQRASLDEVCEALTCGRLAREHLNQAGGYITLRGREELSAVRKARQRTAARLWPAAVHYGKILGRLPFVRMTAVTGALAVSNVDGRLDLDFLVVTEPGRLWVCRAIGILLVRYAQQRNVLLCPNYYLAENRLQINDRSLYTAHELAQMVPVAGMDVYERMRAVNDWTRALLPNALGAPEVGVIQASNGRHSTSGRGLLRSAVETGLRAPAVDRLERWEMERKIRKFNNQPGDRAEVNFGADWCKGHFDGHGRRALAAFEARVERLGLAQEAEHLLQGALEGMP